MNESLGPGEASRRRILVEVLVYVAIVLAFGAAFVAFRVAKDGSRVLTHAPHAEPAPPR